MSEMTDQEKRDAIVAIFASDANLIAFFRGMIETSIVAVSGENLEAFYQKVIALAE